MMKSIILLIGLVSTISAQPQLCGPCPAIFAPVCCNGVDYSSDCFARCDCADADISDGPCPSVDEPGDVCGSPPDDCAALRCACVQCPDGINESGCCSDCVLDDELTCQSISSCPNNCANTVCDEKLGEWCIEDDLAGPSCTSCAAITCESGQSCEFGIGCQHVLTCANVLCSQEKPYCIYDDINGPRCVEACQCDTDDDCETGFVCNETPVGFEGCSDATDSCFGFCSRIEGGCLGFANAPCDGAEICIRVGGTQGTCYAPQETCNNPTITCANVDCQPGATCIDDPVEGPQCIPIFSCGDIDYCTSYIENNCNTCICDANGLEACTEMACRAFVPPELAGNRCETCVDGFSPSDDGLSCEFPGDCICTREFAPVCCNGYTYANSCTAACAGCSADQIQDGGCITTCDDITCESGEKCVYDPTNGGRCVDEDVCCDPQVIIDTPGICREGCQCCPDGQWSGSIGDADTYCGGLKVSAGDTFGEVCDGDNNGNLKECSNNGRNSECSRGYKCRPNPNCRGNSGRCNPRRVCLDMETGFCSSDSDCDASNGYSCYDGGYGNGQCIKFEEP